MIRTAIVGLGKMGLSHLSIVRAHPEVDLVGICDTSKYTLDVLQKYTGLASFTDYMKMLDHTTPDAVVVATPSRTHAGIVRAALERGIHVFCEKPFCLDWRQANDLAKIAAERKLVSQVGYHYRFVGAFQEVKRLVETGAIGDISHALAEAYGPVVLRTKGLSWRTQKEEGGGCLYDYAAHPVNLLNWFFGAAKDAGGTAFNRLFSRDTEDEVIGTLRFADDIASQLSVNWSDESYRKMSVKITIWGTAGRIYADRQECQVYLRNTDKAPSGYKRGWNVRYTTDLTNSVWFYLRGEEYSAQIDYFVSCVKSDKIENVNSFADAAKTDHALALLLADANRGNASVRSKFDATKESCVEVGEPT